MNKTPSTPRSDSTGPASSDLNKTASTDKMPSSIKSNRLDSGASANLQGDDDDEPDTQEILDTNHGASGMAFTVTQQTNSSSVLLPAPAPQASNAVTDMTFQDFLRSVDTKEKKNQGCEADGRDDDYVLSSSESSEEDIY